MRAHYSEGEIVHVLKNGLRFVSPIYDKPSRGYPFRAIIEAAGVPGVSEGKGKLTRKRFVRLVMSTGNGRREAEHLAWAAHRHGISYRECLQRTMIPAILRGDAAMETMQANIREINNRHKAAQDPHSESEEHGQDVPGIRPV